MSVYRYTCRGLFERHKLLFSFQMCVKIMENAGKLNMDEYSFFLRGGVVCQMLRVQSKCIRLYMYSLHVYNYINV